MIIMDLQMPGVDGIELLRDLAADKSGAKMGPDERCRWQSARIRAAAWPTARPQHGRHAAKS
jgi:CheY-like chemotaxis protein